MASVASGSPKVKIGTIRRSKNAASVPISIGGSSNNKPTFSAPVVTANKPTTTSKPRIAISFPSLPNFPTVSASKTPAVKVSSSSSSVKVLSKTTAAGFDLDRTIDILQQNQVLTQLAKLGLLSRLERAGLKLSTLTPLLRVLDELDVLGYVEQNADTVLPLVQKGVELTPSLLPLAAKALTISPAVLSNAALVAFLAGVGEVLVIPDTSVTTVALQTALFLPLGVILPGSLMAASAVLNKLK